MYNNKNLKKIAAVLAWVLVITLILSAFSFMVFAETGSDNTQVVTGETEMLTSQVFAAAQKADELEIYDELEFMGDLALFIEENYVEQISVEDILNGAYQGIFDHLDPYSAYYISASGSSDFAQSAAGTFYGLGILLEKDDKGVKIKEFYGDSSGQKAGLKEGDYFVSVDGQDVTNADTAEVASLLRGNLNTKVNVTVQRDGKEYSYQAVRTKVFLTSVTAGIVEDDIGYMSISNFYETTAQEVEDHWLKLKTENPNIKGLIVDIRNNPGGLVDVAVQTADLFLDKNAKIMHYMKKEEIIATYKADREKIIDVPTVLLANEHSASAAEVLAGALKDNKTATLVGNTTYGKGAAQMVYSLANGASMKLTVLYFLSPDQHQINEVGVVPDYVVYNGSSEEMEEKLQTVGALAPMSENKKYTKGETGLNVFGAQQRLMVLGEKGLSPNATMDEQTYEAIKRFQKTTGLYVYGVLDFATMKALDSAIAGGIFGIDQDNQYNKAISLLK